MKRKDFWLGFATVHHSGCFFLHRAKWLRWAHKCLNPLNGIRWVMFVCVHAERFSKQWGLTAMNQRKIEMHKWSRYRPWVTAPSMLLFTWLSVLLAITSSSFLFWLMFNNVVALHCTPRQSTACIAHILGYLRPKPDSGSDSILFNPKMNSQKNRKAPIEIRIQKKPFMWYCPPWIHSAVVGDCPALFPHPGQGM